MITDVLGIRDDHSRKPPLYKMPCSSESIQKLFKFGICASLTFPGNLLLRSHDRLQMISTEQQQAHVIIKKQQ